MKRFSDTARMDEEWYSALPPEMKCAWEYMWAKCDCAGVWTPSFRLADFHIGKKVDWDSVPEKLGSRLFILPNGSWWICDFVRTQCGNLTPECRAHLPVIARLKMHGLIQDDSLSIVYPMTTGSHKEKEQEQEKNGDSEKKCESTSSEFDEFWKAYPRRVGKGNAEAAWKKHGCAKLLPQILTAVRSCKISPDWTKEGGQFIPHPATWLNRKGWEDELFIQNEEPKREQYTLAKAYGDDAPPERFR